MYVYMYTYIYIYVEIHIGMEYKLQRPHRDVTGMMANGTTIPLNGKTFSFSVVNYYDLSRHVYIGFAVSFFSSKFSSLFGRTIPADDFGFRVETTSPTLFCLYKSIHMAMDQYLYIPF